ncbi:TatD family hydrolase [Marinibactrum halimedae]|uniref:TatD family hydrolase n=1 Tax=Marinibactrum halimedae TaxID=1444977 RepID=A0AA37T6B9_9GAMM|nr:TatD family hydrolase [Marinibactrum halimedae]MCD9460098.1 TatD family hydrolase [Marinibactrum halimedae]GLS26499.1 TatD family hydrolase [Marinibactrum halimedae]
MLIDSHCHLDRIDLSPYNNQLSQALEAARERGVQQFLCIGISLENLKSVVSIAQSHQDVWASVGVHPLDVSNGLASYEELVEWASQEKVVAIGETGLDYYYSKETNLIQQESFVVHLQAAKEAGLPVVVHTRDAREDTINLIKQHGSEASAGVLHCFTEDWDMAKKALDLNYYISISGIVTFRNAGALRDVVKKIPLDRLLVETDSPYLAPVPYRGKSNEPKFVREVAEYIAQLQGVSFETLANITTENFYRLFHKSAASQ